MDAGHTNIITHGMAYDMLVVGLHLCTEQYLMPILKLVSTDTSKIDHTAI
jgi:hypothetical protein